MEIKIDNRVAIGIGVVVAAIVGYQEYSEPDGFLNGLNSNQAQTQNWGPNPSPYGPHQSSYGPNAQPNAYGPNHGYPNPNYGPESGYGPNVNGPAGPAGPNGGYLQNPQNPNPYGPQNGPQNGPQYGPQYGPQIGPQNGYGPDQTDYTSDTYEVDLGEPTEPDGW